MCGGLCAERLDRLLMADWVRRDPVAMASVKHFLLSASRGVCHGFCQTPYLCKLHMCPATRRKGTDSACDRKVSQFCCPHPHDKVAKGRHHEQFAFFCSDPCCAPGKWYSREETHKKARANAAGLAASQVLIRVKQENKDRVQPRTSQNSAIDDKEGTDSTDSAANQHNTENSSVPPSRVLGTEKEIWQCVSKTRSDTVVLSFDSEGHYVLEA
eukprot:m51a1_g5933 hypothetical protein (213) ;mRNA; r:90219-91284